MGVCRQRPTAGTIPVRRRTSSALGAPTGADAGSSEGSERDTPMVMRDSRVPPAGPTVRRAVPSKATAISGCIAARPRITSSSSTNSVTGSVACSVDSVPEPSSAASPKASPTPSSAVWTTWSA